MNRIIRVSVRDKVAVSDNTLYVCGNSDFVVIFDFDHEWDAFSTKTARFVWNGKYHDQVFTGNECPVPVMTNTHRVLIGIFAGELHSTTPAYCPARKSILCEDGLPAPPPDNVYAQIMEKLDEVRDVPGIVEEYVNAVEASADEVHTNMLTTQKAMQTAKTYAENAQANAQSAENSRSNAEQHARNAEKSAQDALVYAKMAQSAEAASNAATRMAESAQSSAQYANGSALSAANSAEQARRDALSVNADVIDARIAEKGDNLEFDSTTGLLWMTAGGVRIGDGIRVATSGGGGSGESNNAELSLSNTTGWIYKTVSQGAPAEVSFDWSSLEDGMETGAGILKITVGSTIRYTGNIEQGHHTIDIGEYLSAGSNTVKLNVTDVYGNSRSLSFNLTVVSMVLESSFDSAVAYTGDIMFTYTPTAAVEKTVHFKVDGKEIGTSTVIVSGRQQTYTVPAQAHGCHSLEVYFTAVINEEEVESNHLHYSIICTEVGNNTPILAVDWRTTTVEQFSTLSIPYTAYDPDSLTCRVSTHSSEIGASSELTVDRTRQIWSYQVKGEGRVTLTLSCAGASGKVTTEVIELTATATAIDVNAETNDMSLYLTSYGRSNNEANPGTWNYGDVSATMTGFNFTSDGWMQDNDGVTVLRVGGDARVEIPVQMFAKDFRTTGKTIEIEFASRSVLDYDAVLATCWAGDRGFKITAQQASLKSEQSEVTARYKEDDHLRLSFVIEKRSDHRLIIAYVNGIISGMMQYPDDDDFSQSVPVSISLGSNQCTIDIYNIRLYENGLNRFQILDNWIADTQNLSDKKDRYDRNNIFNDYGQILPSTLRPHQCYLIINCPVLPTYKGDKKTCSGMYVDPQNPKNSFTFSDAEIDVQGTSSQFYYVKNFKIKFKGGFNHNGIIVATYAMNDNAVPTNEFTFKADVASSEGANNVVLAEMYNELCPVKTPAQRADYRVRQTIEGHPIVVFHDDGNGAKFIGKYNFNNDKGTEEVFGFKTGDESWEILENGNALVSFKSDDFTNWETSFEARYPDKNTDTTKLQAFVSWVASTDTTVQGLTEDQRAQRLEKFKNELSNWADVDDAIFYYLFTLIFLCIDQREKNAFPTWNEDMKKWIWLFYDADSSIGTDNKGNLTFEYWMEDIDYTEAGDPVFNGQNNVFWSNLRVCFTDKLRDEYRRLRTELGADGKPLLSFDRVNDLFHAHQSQWSEAIYNEDAWRKAVEPLEKAGDAQYLPMQQGKKEQHFKHWTFNRFRYLDSKFETGAALDDENRIMMRAHAQGNIFLTSYINMYGQVYFNAARAEHRMTRDQEYEFVWSAEGAEDAVIGINSAPMITSLGDLSPLMLEYAHIQYAKHLTELKIGDGTMGYVNDNFVALTLGNNTLLKKLDVRNCVSLTQSVDASGCTNIEEAYFDGTSISGLSLPNGGIVKTLHLPGTITNLTLRNQTKLTEFVLPDYSNITTLRLENVSSAVPMNDILMGLPANSRVRVLGLDLNMESADQIRSTYDYFDTMRGLDENGNNVDKAQISGTIHVDTITEDELAAFTARYSDLKIVYNTLIVKVEYCNWDGDVLYTLMIEEGGNAIDPVELGYIEAPTREGTDDLNYAFASWNELPTDIHANTTIVAQYTNIWTVYYRDVDDSELYRAHVIEGADAIDPVELGYLETPTREGTNDYGYLFVSWDNLPTNVCGVQNVYAQYVEAWAVRFYNEGVVVNTQYVQNGLSAVDPVEAEYIDTPVKESTPYYNYTFNGWDKTFDNITGVTSVNAMYAESERTYTVRFWYDDALLHTVTGIKYGESATFPGDDPVKEGEWVFKGWNPAPTNVVADMDCYATFVSTATVSKKLVERTLSGDYVNDRVNSIGMFAFMGCSKLTSVDFPEVTTIKASSLADCSALTALILRNTSKRVTLDNVYTFDGSPIKNGTGYIYVPSALVDSYKSATNWSAYAARFRALEDYTVDGTTTGELDETKI